MFFRQLQVPIVVAVILLLSHQILADDMKMGMPIDLTPPPDPQLMEAKALIEELPYSVRDAVGSQLSFDYSWRAAVLPKLNQLINGEEVPAPAVDPGYCRQFLSPLPTTSRDTESVQRLSDETVISRESTETVTEYSDVMRSTEAVTDYPVATRNTDVADISYWDSFRSEIYQPVQPEITLYDLCLQRQQMATQDQAFGGKMDQITQLVVNTLKAPNGNVAYHKQLAETYLTALTIVYLKGRLVSQEGMAPYCGTANLIDLEFLLPEHYPQYWFHNYAEFKDEYGLRQLVYQLACLSDEEAMRLVTAFAKASEIVDDVVAATQPKQFADIRKGMDEDFLPLMIALFDRTKSVGPVNPLYKVLLDYRKSQGVSEKSDVRALFLYNPGTQIHEEVAVCDSSVMQNANDYVNDLWGSGPGPKTALQYLMQSWLDKYNSDFKKGLGPKTVYGAAITMVSVQSTTLSAPVWITDAWTPSNSHPPCVYLPNFMHVLLHPMPLGQATCPAWDTARLGKACPYKAAAPSVSQAEKNQDNRLVGFNEILSDWIMPSAHAEEPPKPKCFMFDENTGETKILPADDPLCKTVCPCGNEVDDFGKTTLKCKVCPYGGGSTAEKTYSCKDICKYRYGMAYAGGAELSFPGGCYLSTPLVEADNVGSVVVPNDDHCSIAKTVKSLTINPTEYESCLEKGSCCGNGIVEEGESCDDGNGITTDQCNNFCKAGSDCKAACNFGYGGPATKMLKKIVDSRTGFHPVYRWLGTGLFMESVSCKLPETISDGKVTLEKGKPCHEIMAPLLAMVQAEQKTCVTKCQAANPNLPSPASGKAAECYAQCAPEKLSECKAAKDYYAKMVQPGCALKFGVLQGDKLHCKPGAPCTCGWDFVLEPCKQLVAACKADCANKFKDALHNDELGQICQDWTQSHTGVDSDTTSMAFFQETVKAMEDLTQYAKPQTINDALKIAKEAGGKKVDALFGTMMDWIDYNQFSSSSSEDRALVKDAVKYALQGMSTCDNYRSQALLGKIKDGLGSLVAIGPVVAQGAMEYGASQTTMEKTFYYEVEEAIGQFDYWEIVNAQDKAGKVTPTLQLQKSFYKLKPEFANLTDAELEKLPIPEPIVKAVKKTGSEILVSLSKVKVPYAYMALDKVVPTLKAFAILGRASLIADFYEMGGDTPLKPSFELASQLQLCVNPVGLQDMNPEELAKLGVQQAMVAAMQFQDWVRNDSADGPKLASHLVDEKITKTVKDGLAKLGIKLPEKTNDSPGLMSTVCESYFSGS